MLTTDVMRREDASNMKYISHTTCMVHIRNSQIHVLIGTNEISLNVLNLCESFIYLTQTQSDYSTLAFRIQYWYFEHLGKVYIDKY